MKTVHIITCKDKHIDDRLFAYQNLPNAELRAEKEIAEMLEMRNYNEDDVERGMGETWQSAHWGEGEYSVVIETIPLS